MAIPTRGARAATLFLVTLAIGIALAAACSTQPTQGRFPVCKVDADCAGREGVGVHCYDLRCVDCRGDDDCKPGSVCNGAKQCESLSSSSPPATESDAGMEKETWESSSPADHDKCVAACKGKADCVKKCGGGPISPKK